MGNFAVIKREKVALCHVLRNVHLTRIVETLDYQESSDHHQEYANATEKVFCFFGRRQVPREKRMGSRWKNGTELRLHLAFTRDINKGGRKYYPRKGVNLPIMR